MSHIWTSPTGTEIDLGTCTDVRFVTDELGLVLVVDSDTTYLYRVPGDIAESAAEAAIKVWQAIPPPRSPKLLDFSHHCAVEDAGKLADLEVDDLKQLLNELIDAAKPRGGGRRSMWQFNTLIPHYQAVCVHLLHTTIRQQEMINNLAGRVLKLEGFNPLAELEEGLFELGPPEK